MYIKKSQICGMKSTGQTLLARSEKKRGEKSAHKKIYQWPPIRLWVISLNIICNILSLWSNSLGYTVLTKSGRSHAQTDGQSKALCTVLYIKTNEAALGKMLAHFLTFVFK